VTSIRATINRVEPVARPTAKVADAGNPVPGEGQLLPNPANCSTLPDFESVNTGHSRVAAQAGAVADSSVIVTGTRKPRSVSKRLKPAAISGCT
jgi:hypothetical protein